MNIFRGCLDRRVYCVSTLSLSVSKFSITGKCSGQSVMFVVKDKVIFVSFVILSSSER